MSDEVIAWLQEVATAFDCVVFIIRGHGGPQALMLPRRLWMVLQ